MAEFVACPNSAPFRAIVTGAADGTGADWARALARHGVTVALADIDKVPLARLANELGAHAFACDVLSEHCVTQFIPELFEALPGIDLLINAAGKGYVRSLGMMRVSRAFAAATAVAGHPATIVNVPSSRSGRPERFEYAASNHAFVRLSNGLAAVLEDLGITVVMLGQANEAAAIDTTVAELCRDAQAAAAACAELRRARG